MTAVATTDDRAGRSRLRELVLRELPARFGIRGHKPYLILVEQLRC